MGLCAHAALDSSAVWTVSADRTRSPAAATKRKPRRSPSQRRINFMAREIITIECTEARKEGKSPSRYTTTRNKKLQTEKLEIKKFNPFLRRHTIHREVK